MTRDQKAFWGLIIVVVGVIFSFAWLLFLAATIKWAFTYLFWR